MRINIDRNRCVGHARCAAVAPDIYPLDADGFIATDGFTVPEGQEKLSLRGARACPERVIHVEDRNEDSA